MVECASTLSYRHNLPALIDGTEDNLLLIKLSTRNTRKSMIYHYHQDSRQADNMELLQNTITGPLCRNFPGKGTEMPSVDIFCVFNQSSRVARDLIRFNTPGRHYKVVFGLHQKWCQNNTAKHCQFVINRTLEGQLGFSSLVVICCQFNLLPGAAVLGNRVKCHSVMIKSEIDDLLRP